MTTAYNADAVPFGGILVALLRPGPDPENPTVGATALGNYVVENLSPTEGSILGKRPGVDGGRGGFWIVNGETEGNVKIQVATGATPTPMNGDYFEVNDASVEADASGVAVLRRYVLHNVQRDISTETYRSVSASVIVDQ